MSATDYESLIGIRSLFRKYTGLSETADITDDDVDVLANNFFKGPFVKDVKTDEFLVDYNVDTAATDSGEYSLPANITWLDDPVRMDGKDLTLYRDQALFRELYPDDMEDYTTPPTLAIGTDSTKVLNSAFSYTIANYVYEKASTETALSGDTIPSGKYGAYLLTIDDDGDITVTDGATNSTGWDTVAQAINDLTTIPASSAIMGVVTVINSSGTFVPGTTALDAGTVTDTYTDGNPSLRNAPDACLVLGRKLFVRPKPMDIYRIKFPLTLKRPDELSADDDTVFNEEWGTAIALGAAIAYLVKLGDTETVSNLMGPRTADIPGTFHYVMGSIKGERLMQDDATDIYRSW